jgi:micrococcal nuclease
MNNEQVRFYNKSWFMWAMFLLFAPLGVYLLWKNKRYNRTARLILTIVFSSLFLFAVIPSNNKNTSNNTVNRQNAIDKSSENIPANPGSTPSSTLPQSTQTGQTAFEAVKVVRTVDGDTIEASLINGNTEKIRLIGINTPESTTRHEPYGSEASTYTKQSLTGKTIYIEKDVSNRDKYGRLLRIVWLENPGTIDESSIRSKMFNAILVLNGYAQVSTYPPDVKYSDYFTKFTKEAREAGIGLWSLEGTKKTPAQESTLKPSKATPPTTKPSSPKPSSTSQANGKIKGNISSSGEKIYHVPGGAFYDKTIAEEYFDTEAEAQAAGYRRSKR